MPTDVLPEFAFALHWASRAEGRRRERPQSEKHLNYSTVPVGYVNIVRENLPKSSVGCLQMDCEKSQYPRSSVLTGVSGMSAFLAWHKPTFY